ncbi:MAG: DUF4435 domain-containing protein [Magnetococcus sp. YQC-5]
MGSLLDGSVTSGEFSHLYNQSVRFTDELSDGLEKRASKRIILYVESKEDYEIFRERWFSHLSEWITFHAVDDVNGGGGGSAVVYRRVKHDRERDICSYGIVDRDVLLNGYVTGRPVKWDAFFEPNHEIFKNAVSGILGSYIKVLRRWEIENYLLHPVAVREFLKDSKLNKSLGTKSSTERLLDFSEIAIILTATELALMKLGQSWGPLKMFYEINDAHTLMSKLMEKMRKDNLSVIENEINENCQKIKRFLLDDADNPDEKWNQINHLINGKIFLERFFVGLGLKDSPQYHLASKISDDLIDPELQEFMGGLKEEAERLFRGESCLSRCSP